MPARNRRAIQPHTIHMQLTTKGLRAAHQEANHHHVLSMWLTMQINKMGVP